VHRKFLVNTSDLVPNSPNDPKLDTSPLCSKQTTCTLHFIINCTLQRLRGWRKGVTLRLSASELRVRDWGSERGPEISQRGLGQSAGRKQISVLSMRHRMSLLLKMFQTEASELRVRDWGQ